MEVNIKSSGSKFLFPKTAYFFFQILNNCCPICGKHLELQQINFKSAIFMCLDLECPYPTYGDCVVVRRNIENINTAVDVCALLKQQENKANCKQNIEQYLDNSFFSDFEELMNSQTNSHNIDSDNQNNFIKEETSSQQSIKTENHGEFSEFDDFLTNLLM